MGLDPTRAIMPDRLSGSFASPPGLSLNHAHKVFRLLVYSLYTFKRIRRSVITSSQFATMLDHSAIPTPKSFLFILYLARHSPYTLLVSVEIKSQTRTLVFTISNVFPITPKLSHIRISTEFRRFYIGISRLCAQINLICCVYLFRHQSIKEE